MSAVIDPAAEANFGAERVTHLYPNDCYFAHLSIYRFAAQFAQNGVVLDAGSGAGYGSAYLADHGAQFAHGIDVSAEAVAFSQHYFQRPNLQYQVMSLEEITGFEPHSFDLIYSSNVLEHVPNILAFLRSAWQLLKPDGTMVIAVPPIVNWELQAVNIANPFHYNIWTPRQWYYTLNIFFSNINCYTHVCSRQDVVPNFWNSPDQTIVDENDFGFFNVTIEQIMYVPTITALFLVQKPREDENILPSLVFIDDSFTLPPDDASVRVKVARRLFEQTQLVQELLAPLINELQRDQVVPQSESPECCSSSTVDHNYINLLQAILEEKNEHIAYLEGLLKQIQSGRVMRVLGTVGRLRS
jgi:SAM-dependent methyltransferase